MPVEIDDQLPPPGGFTERQVQVTAIPRSRCTANAKSTGKPCGKTAILGGNVCTQHGGKAPQVARKASERVAMLVDPALDELGKILRNPMTADSDKLRAIKEVLDRAGIKSVDEIKITHDVDPLIAERLARFEAKRLAEANEV